MENRKGFFGEVCFLVGPAMPEQKGHMSGRSWMELIFIILTKTLFSCKLNLIKHAVFWRLEPKEMRGNRLNSCAVPPL